MEKIHPLYSNPDPTLEQIEKLATIRVKSRTLYECFEKECPPGRYRALALTALEQAAMWANKAITHPDES